MSNIFFTSARNLIKRDASTSSTDLAAPVTSAYSGSLYVTNYTVTHNLGFVPLFRVQYEPFKDGIIWPASGTRLGTNTVNPSDTTKTGPGLIAWPTTTQLNLQLFYGSNTLTGTYPVYWVIYKDFQL